MKCGTKCFVVEMEVNEERKIKKVISRTPVSARKTIRMKYGDEAQIISVRENRSKS